MKSFTLLLALLFSCPLIAQTNIQVGEPAPEIIVTHWLRNEPPGVNFKKKYIVLDFWATWCPPCLNIIPHLNELRAEFPREDLYFISLTKESPKVASSVFDRVDFQVSVACDVTGKTELNFGNGITGLSRFPTTVLIDNKNIVRWIGSPQDLTAEMMDRFLTPNLLVAQPNSVFKPVASDPELAGNFEPGKITEAEFYNLLENDSVFTYVNVFELDGEPDFMKKKMTQAFYSLGTHAYFAGATLEDYFSQVHPGMKFVVPAELNDRFFQIAFKNEHPDRESHLQILREIIAQAGYEAEFSTTTVYRRTISIRKESALVPTTSDFRWPKCKEDDFSALICEKLKLTDLADELNKLTDDQWFYEGNNRKRYDFEIFHSSSATILATLKDYGLRVKSEPVEIEVVTVVRGG